jgi:hypothetical protein
MPISDLELNHDEDYRQLIKAVIETAIVDYTKLQHPLNRTKKYLDEGFLSAIDMFFDDSFTFESFTSIENESPLTTADMLCIMINSTEVDMIQTKQHVIDESINYWWTKNFHDIKIPSKIVVYGKTWFVHNAQKQHIDYDKNHLYLPLKSNKADRMFFDLVLQVILKEADINISKADFKKLHKVFYLFLKVNNAFSTK